MENSEQPQEKVNLEELKEKRSVFYDDLEKYAKLCEFADQLKKKYPDYQDYQLYHFLICSTFDHEPSKVDFPGEDSVEKFINSFN